MHSLQVVYMVYPASVQCTYSTGSNVLHMQTCKLVVRPEQHFMGLATAQTPRVNVPQLSCSPAPTACRS